MLNILCLFLLAFAIASGTRLIVDDSISLPFRQWVIRKTGEDSRWTTLVHCIWCTGFYVSLLFTALLFPFLTLPWWTFPLTVMAMRQIAPMILLASDRLSFGGS